MADFDLDLNLGLDLDVDLPDSPLAGVDLDRYDERNRSWATEAGPAILSELVKSYGFKRDARGNWDWSVDNIRQEFVDHPIWTTLDYLTLAYAPARFGIAAVGVSRGAAAAKALGAGARGTRSAIEIGLARGAFTGKGPRTLMGRLARNIGAVSPETAAAAEMKIRGPAKFARGYFSNPITTHIDDEYLKLVDRYGHAPFEAKGIFAAQRREAAMAKSMVQREVADAVEAANKMGLDEYGKRKVFRLLESGAPEYDDLVQAALGRAAKKPADLARMTDWYRRTLDWRMNLHNEAYRLNFFDRATYRANLRGFMPRIYEEYEKILAGMDELKAAAPVVAGGKGLRTGGDVLSQAGKARFMPRAETLATRGGQGLREERNLLRAELDKIKALKAEAPDAFEAAQPAAMKIMRQIDEIDQTLEGLYGKVKVSKTLSQVLNPVSSLAKLGEAKMLVSRAKFIEGFAKSVLAKSPEEVSAAIRQIAATGSAKAAKIHGLNAASADAISKLIKTYDTLTVGKSAVDEEIAKAAGWIPMDTVLKNLGVPGFVNNIPRELRGRWIDPTVAEDFAGMVKFVGDKSKLRRFYHNALSFFRASKTAYNPATGVRNLIGAQLFHHMTVGGLPRLPRLGLKHWDEASPWYRKARELGVIGSSFHHETREALLDGMKSGERVAKMFGSATSIDWLGSGKVARKLQATASVAERTYRGIDEVYKLDAFIRLGQKFVKAGMSEADAAGRALVEVNKFMPSFIMHSPFADVLRAGVPFASFTTEALRIWKNALAEKPHMVFFWNHFVETLQEGSALLAGYSPEQLEEAQAALPHYLQGKKTLALPFNVDGRPQFIDMSYVIPLANLVEAEQPGSLFFDAIIDPTTNPFLGAVAGAATGVDPFSGKPIEPKFTERQLGVAVTNQTARRVVGLGEYMAASMLPPLLPPGYAGTNLLELARGQKHPDTGEPLEDGILKTILANVGAMRMYTPDIESQALNVRREEAMRGQSMTQAWRRYEFARSNGDVETMLAEEERIVALRMASGRPRSEALDYFRTSAANRGAFSDLSKRQLREIINRARKLGHLDPKSQRLMGELMAEYRGARKRRKKRKRR